MAGKEESVRSTVDVKRPPILGRFRALLHRVFASSKLPMAIVLLLWLAIILGGTLLNLTIGGMRASSETNWQLAADLPKHHQLRVEDLRQPARIGAPLPDKASLIGRHLRDEREEGEAIVAAALDDIPEITPIPDHAVVLYSLEGQETALVYILEPGDRVQLCIGGQDATEDCFPNGLLVLATHYETQFAPGNWALLQVSVDEATALAPFLAAEVRFLSLIARP